MAALKIFTVSHGSIRLKVRVLPTARDVHREYLKFKSAGRERIGKGKTVCAFFSATVHVSAKYTGLIVLPSNGRLSELIPHEVTHAVMHKLGSAHRSEDEFLATAIGLLSARILKKMERYFYV